MKEQIEKQAIEEMAKVIKSSLDGLGIGNFNFTGDEISTMFAKALYNAGYRKQNEGEWISVFDRLPTRPGAYLVFTIDRRISMCHFIDHYCDGDMQFDDYRVTHWMPLPEAPKGGAE